MKQTSGDFILGYDPGGDGRHGVAVLAVTHEGQRWQAEKLTLILCKTVGEVMTNVDDTVGTKGRLVATGIDTLTAWGTGNAGWRPADVRLRKKYKAVAKSVDHANHMNGSMCLNGALILRWLSERSDKGGIVTEAHPKVCFFALREREKRHPWARETGSDDEQKSAKQKVLPPPPADKEEAKKWLLNQLGVSEADSDLFGGDDHMFDAALGCLAALKGVNKEWTTDLHHREDVIHPFVQTHYWWPEDLSQNETTAVNHV